MGKPDLKNKDGYVDFGEKPTWPEKPIWEKSFTPWYTPKEMLEMGVFSGKYISSSKMGDAIPKEWYKIKKVLGKDDPPDPDINYFGVQSGESIIKWRERGNLTVNSPLGSFQWYCLYFLGRRCPKEDQWQFRRWRSLVTRHQAAIDKNCRSGQHSCHTKQRQAVLQWGWDSDRSFNKANQDKARERLANMRGITMGKGDSDVAQESLSQPGRLSERW